MKKVIWAVLIIAGFLVLSGLLHKKYFNDSSKPVSAKSTVTVISPVSTDQKNDLTPFRYKIRKGDRLTKIAQRFNTNINDLLSANKGNKNIRNENLLWVGGEINIPSVYPVKEVDATLEFKSELISALNRKAENLKKDNLALSGNHTKYNIALIVALFLTVVMAFFLNEKVEALTLAKDSERSLQNKIAELETESDRLRLERRALLVELTATQHILRLKAQNGQYIEFDIGKLVCRVDGCGTEVSRQNALSHHYKNHSDKEELKEIVDKA